jgi:hypothetical protein
VETGVLEGEGQVDDGLANVLDLLEVADHDLALALVSLVRWVGGVTRATVLQERAVGGW